VLFFFFNWFRSLEAAETESGVGWMGVRLTACCDVGTCVRASLPPVRDYSLCIIKMEVLSCKKLRPPLQEGVSPLSEDAMLELVYV
jgi:hypothetical protein